MSVKLFVYGTLKNGRSNHRVLEGADFISTGVVYGMILHKGPGFPYATNCPGKLVHGELYELDDLDRCDRLEGYPNHYNRKLVPVETNEGTIEAWMYYVDNDSVYIQRYQETTSNW